MFCGPTYIVMGRAEMTGKNFARFKTHFLIHTSHCAGPSYPTINKDNIEEKRDSAAARQMLPAWTVSQEPESIPQRPFFMLTVMLCFILHHFTLHWLTLKLIGYFSAHLPRYLGYSYNLLLYDWFCISEKLLRSSINSEISLIHQPTHKVI